MGERKDGKETCTLVYFGDGATSEGDFHEGMNLAGVLKAAVVFVCTNNQWAISTPIRRQTAARHLVDKAIGYGMPGERVGPLAEAAVTGPASYLATVIVPAKGGNR